MAVPLRLGVLASGRGTNLQAILDACASGGLPARVVLVLSDRRGAPALERAAAAGVPSEFQDPGAHPSREAYDRHLAERLEQAGVELVCLAGWMRILGALFVQRFPRRILNVHPALLPAFPGKDAQRQAIEYGVKVAGCTVHLVDEGVDTGPIVLQAAVAVHEEDTADTLAERILEHEHRLVVEAVRLFAERRLRLEGRRVRILAPTLPRSAGLGVRGEVTGAVTGGPVA